MKREGAVRKGPCTPLHGFCLQIVAEPNLHTSMSVPSVTCSLPVTYFGQHLVEITP